MNQTTKNSPAGILLVNKAKGSTSFSLVRSLRKLTNVQKIGHAGTLDPLATGVMVMLIGKKFTQQADKLLNKDKEYEAKILLGKTTDTYDQEGKVLSASTLIPTLEELEAVLQTFQGEILQLPPMFSAKKHQGKKLYELARLGKEIERKPCKVHLKIALLSYSYPYIDLHIVCSKGTYIRSLAHDLGQKLGCGGHLSELIRKRVGPFPLSSCVEEKSLKDPGFDLQPWLNNVPIA